MELSKASTQVHHLAWDLPRPPATMFLCFLWEAEVMGGGGGIGDTHAKFKKLLSTCPDNFYRPLRSCVSWTIKIPPTHRLSKLWDSRKSGLSQS